LIIESFGSPLSSEDRKILPGALDNFVLDVIATARTVPILLVLNPFAEIITIGRRYPGSEPLGVTISAQ